MKKPRIKFGCEGKAKYKSARMAKLIARRRDDRKWYLCENCHFYHVGSSVHP